MNASENMLEAPRLPGDRFIWYVIALECATFGVLFLSFAGARAFHVEMFNTSQRELDVNMGAFNTALLLTASWCVARAVAAVRAAAQKAGLLWLGTAIAGGLGFVIIKALEYADKAERGFGLSYNLFFDFYYVLTGFHLLHVVAGLFALAVAGVSLMQQPLQEDGALSAYALETVGAFWHLVDMLWLVLFPLVYVVH